jgi:iron-sulfur cluster repair protein YtfE (RIC family)
MAVMTSPALEPGVSVKETLQRFPVTLAVFQQFGIHLCCGSDASIVEAAHRDGADADRLIAALRLSILAEVRR